LTPSKAVGTVGTELDVLGAFATKPQHKKMDVPEKIEILSSAGSYIRSVLRIIESNNRADHKDCKLYSREGAPIESTLISVTEVALSHSPLYFNVCEPVEKGCLTERQGSNRERESQGVDYPALIIPASFV
jgi:hypothetical protein